MTAFKIHRRRFAVIAVAACLALPVLGTTTMPGHGAQGDCEMQVQPFNFGAFRGKKVTARGKIYVQCPRGQKFTINLIREGAFTMSGARQRSRALNYQLHTDANMKIRWGKSNDVSARPIRGVGTGRREAYFFYGRIDSQRADPGVLSSSVTVVLEY